MFKVCAVSCSHESTIISSRRLDKAWDKACDWLLSQTILFVQGSGSTEKNEDSEQGALNRVKADGLNRNLGNIKLSLVWFATM